MKRNLRNTAAKATPIITIGIFVIIVLFGLNLSVSQMNQAHLHSCPIMDSVDTLCDMGLIEHMREWQKLFTASLVGVNTFLSFLLISFVAVVFIASLWNRRQRLMLISHQFFLLYLRSHREIPVFNYITSLFSRGILNSRIYA